MANEPDKDKEYTTKELVDMEVKTRMEALHYVKKKLEIGNKIYYKAIYPRIKEDFAPIVVNESRTQVSKVVIVKARLDEVIADCKKRALDKIKQNRNKRS